MASGGNNSCASTSGPLGSGRRREFGEHSFVPSAGKSGGDTDGSAVVGACFRHANGAPEPNLVDELQRGFGVVVVPKLLHEVRCGKRCGTPELVQLGGKAGHELSDGSCFVTSPAIETSRSMGFPKGVVEGSFCW